MKEETAPNIIRKNTPGLYVEYDFPIVKENTNEVSLNQWISENKGDFYDQLYQHGAILFRGFSINTVKKFEKINDLFDTDALAYAFRSSPRFSVGKNVYTSTSYPKEYSINMHSEASYMPKLHPRFIVFCCINPATERGETPIADNRKVLSLLSEKTKTRFIEKGIKYVRNLNETVGLSWQEVFQTKDKEVVTAECERTGTNFKWRSENDLELTWTKKAIWDHPVTQEKVWFNHASFFNKFSQGKDYIHTFTDKNKIPNDTYFGDGSEISYEEINEILEAYKKATIEFSWKKGDVLFLDNILASHSRNPYEGKRKIITSLF